MTELWIDHDTKKKAANLRDDLRLPESEKFKRDAIAATTTEDSNDRYESSPIHSPLGNGNFRAVNLIGDAARRLYS